MYQVYRFVNGYKQNNIATFATLREAYDHAQQAKAHEQNPSVEYRIFGLIPEDLPGSSKSPHRKWFVLDRAPQPPGTERASRFLRKRKERPVTSTRTPSARTFRVEREVHGVRRTLRDGLASQADARAFIADQKAKERDPSAIYIIVAPPDKPKHSGMPVGGRSSVRRGAPRLRGYLAGSKREGVRHDWEVEDRKGDASLVERSEEELGLGIPAQTNKGRRSRKGEYIP